MLAVTGVGCGSTATITSRDGSRYELAILRSTPDAVIVDSRDGARAIPRDQIRDIDHPGNVLETAGAMLFLLGAAALLRQPECDGRTSVCLGWAGAAGLAGGGLTMTIVGGLTWTRSVRAATAQDASAPASNF
ncbi:MAG TPA: hypothetical protein VN962_10560 [Polyangia bacterium]|nr:hypothetical protein [Polyangia bacterium]